MASRGGKKLGLEDRLLEPTLVREAMDGIEKEDTVRVRYFSVHAQNDGITERVGRVVDANTVGSAMWDIKVRSKSYNRQRVLFHVADNGRILTQAGRFNGWLIELELVESNNEGDNR